MLQALGLYVACCDPRPTAHCHAWYRDYVFRRQVPMPGHSGLAVILQISSVQQLPAEEPHDQEDVSMLQVNGRAMKSQPVKTLLLDDLLPPDPKVIVDFTHAAEAYYAIMNVTFEYMTAWPDDLDLPDETMQALATLHDHQHVHAKSYHFYVDGSKVAGYGVGAATACLIESEEGMTLAGVVPTHVDFAEYAYIGEHVAMLHALLWALQLSTWHLTHWSHLPVSFSFNFDALNTGYQAAGWWRAHEHKEWQTLFRSLAHVLEYRHGSRQIAWNHIRAHAQHPWNELVDRVAKFASKHPTQVGDCRQWYYWLSDAPFLVAVQWIWYLEAMRAQSPQAAPLRGLLLEHTLRKPVHHIEGPAVSVTAASPMFTDIQIDMILATANVLTLTASSGNRATSITRQQILMQQFSEAGCHVVGLQETRHRHLRDLSNPYYHIVGAPATAEGHDGVQIWISKTLAFYTDGPLVCKQDILVVEARPTYLIVKLRLPHWRCLLVTARAPHSGHGLQQAERFWNVISARLRQLSRHWPVFFVGDTNGHLGEEITTAVGPHYPRKENDSGTAFHHWLLEQQMFVPATFSQYCKGDTMYTFVSLDGDRTSRIDYIALPTQIQYDHLQTWMEEGIDISTQRLDHLPVLCHLVLTKRIAGDSSRKRGGVPCNLGLQARLALQHPVLLHDLQDAITMPPWIMDPHQTADHLTMQSQAAVHSMLPAPKRRPRKTHISDETWHLVDVKKQLFRQLRALQRTRTHTFVKAIFQAWRGSDPAVRLRGWLPICDHAIATTMHSLRKATLEVTKAVRAEDAAHYAALAQRAANTYSGRPYSAMAEHQGGPPQEPNSPLSSEVRHQCRPSSSL